MKPLLIRLYRRMFYLLFITACMLNVNSPVTAQVKSSTVGDNTYGIGGFKQIIITNDKTGIETITRIYDGAIPAKLWEKQIESKGHTGGSLAATNTMYHNGDSTRKESERNWELDDDGQLVASGQREYDINGNIKSGTSKYKSGDKWIFEKFDPATGKFVEVIPPPPAVSNKQPNPKPVSGKATTKPVVQEKWLITYTYKNGPAGKFYALLKSNKKWDYANGSGNGQTPQIVDYGNWTKTSSDMVLTWKEPAFHGTYKGKYNGTSASGTMERIEQYINGTWTAKRID